MRGYMFDLNCPHCGREMAHVTSGSRYPWQQAVVAMCQPCRRSVIINVTMTLAEAKDGADFHAAVVQRYREQEHEAAMERSRRVLEGVGR